MTTFTPLFAELPRELLSDRGAHANHERPGAMEIPNRHDDGTRTTILPR